VAQAYERSGYHAYHVAEHHSTPPRNGLDLCGPRASKSRRPSLTPT
jgi:alkanesulfonate monooxygenase SsuD/methylene tetrahydromethanopterin reductase-like flavin-dependent oxidoreductase (luciferase family)